MITARNLTIGKLMLFAVFVLACLWARLWLADRKVDIPAPDMLPGDPVPRNYWCDWSKQHDNQVLCSMPATVNPLRTTYFTMDFQDHTVRFVSQPVENLRAGDVLIAWGQPDTVHIFGTRIRWIEMCWLRTTKKQLTTCVRAYGWLFSPQATVTSISYDSETSQAARAALYNQWRGFTQRH